MRNDSSYDNGRIFGRMYITKRLCRKLQKPFVEANLGEISTCMKFEHKTQKLDFFETWGPPQPSSKYLYKVETGKPP